jgi:hypothetical protein
MIDDLQTPIHAICPGCGEPSRDLLAHAPHCSTPEAVDLQAGFEEQSLEIRAAIKEIEFVLTTLPAEEAAAYTSRLAQLHEELSQLTATSTIRRQLLDILRERRLLLDGSSG